MSWAITTDSSAENPIEPAAGGIGDEGDLLSSRGCPSGNNRNRPSATLGVGGRPLEVAVVSKAVADKYGLQVGTPALSSAGAITFGPEGILFVGASCLTPRPATR